MKAYSYIRFSTPEQSQGDSKRRQTDLAADYVKRNGLTLDTELNMSDLGISGFKGKNLAETAALGGFLKAIENGEVDSGSVLLVESLDRISRKSARQAIRILESIVESGVDVVTLNDGKRYDLDAINGFDFMMAFMVLMRGHEESNTKSKRNAASWVQKRAAAAVAGKARVVATSVVPAWIDVTGAANKDSGHNAKLSLNPERAKIVKRIFREFLEGAGYSKITIGLNKDRMKTWGRSAEWHPKYVYKILHWRAVLGEYTSKGTVTADYFPRAIDDDTFEAAQALFGTRGHLPPRSRLRMNILSQLATCPKCGSSMRRKRGANNPKLVCSRADHGGKCDHVSVDLVEIETALTRWDCKIPRKDASLDDALKVAQRDKGALEFDIEMLVNEIIKRPSAALSKRLAQMEARLVQSTAQLADLQAKAAESDSRVLKGRAAKLKEALGADKLDRAAVNVALRMMLSKVVVEYPTAELVLHWKHDGVTRLDINDKLIAAKEFRA